MKISLNWLKQYIDITLEPEKIGELLTDLGLEVEGLDTIESVPGGLRGFVTAKVLTCERFEVKDKKLSLCTVDLGDGNLPSQIVCGAPNVDVGQKVIIATVGTTLYNSDGTPLFTIDKKKTYGHFSEGMICAEDELGVGISHDGIMVLPPDTPIGIPAATYFNITSDVVFEIGLTPNRSDATNHIGVAMDLAAALRVRNNEQTVVKLPNVSSYPTSIQNSLPISVIVENAEACPRYCGVVIRNIRVSESPAWLKQHLSSIGIRSINNIVDITNFVLHELGQPLHAFDYDAITQQKIVVKTLPEGTKFLSLDEVERKLFAEDLMICDGNNTGMCIGGVFGGLRSGVTNATTTLFLESAHFNPKYIRRSSTRHNLRTEAAKIFEKGSDPSIAPYALRRAALLIQALAGGEVASELIDIYPTPIHKKEVLVRFQHINNLIGEDLSRESVKNILTALHIDMQAATDTHFVAIVPTNKADVTREADVIEEILRIYGYNRVHIPTQIKTAVNVAPNPDPFIVKNSIADFLAASGFNEMMAMSITQSKYCKEVLPFDENLLVYINNTANIHLDVMRPTMLFSGLEAIAHNQNRQQTDIKLFEFGKKYIKRADTPNSDSTDTYTETEHLTLFISGMRNGESWLQAQQPTNFYTLKAQVNNVLQRLGMNGWQESVLHDATPFSLALRYHRGAQTIVTFGQVSPTILKKMDIKQAVFYAEFDWVALLQSQKNKKIIMTSLNKFPTVRRDLALVIDKTVRFNDIQQLASKTGKPLLQATNLFDVYENEQQLGEGKKSYAVSFVFEDASKTLKDEEVDNIMQQLIAAYTTQLGAVVRR
ncbi:MAG: phenylalanine--tRNA ligase subunit beta [Saprospiraceae bacterium]|nr:phenylalanine--tRNA ligase subunit beta [Saprospiraceae bacterium]MBP7679872.1 phenylalanine--tRNA ligase subunit beta [Saprospiraceae bacterium]